MKCAAATAGSLASGVLRAALLKTLQRPALETPIRPVQVNSRAAEDGESVVWEEWVVHTEPGPQGKVPVLLAKDRGRSGPLPTVLWLHGTGGSKESLTAQLTEYAKEGYLAVSIDTRYHGARGDLAAYHSALVSAWETGSESPFIYDTTHDLMHVLDFLQTRDDVDAYRIGATGISLGGMHAWMLAAADERVAAVAPMIGVQGFRWAVEHDQWHARVSSLGPVFLTAAAAAGAELDSAVVRSVWDRLNPGLVEQFDAPHTLPLIAPRPLLVLNGADDPRCPMAGVELAMVAAREVYERLGASSNVEAILEPGVGHAITPAMLAKARSFFRKHLLDNVKDPSEGHATLATL